LLLKSFLYLMIAAGLKHPENEKVVLIPVYFLTSSLCNLQWFEINKDLTSSVVWCALDVNLSPLGRTLRTCML